MSNVSPSQSDFDFWDFVSCAKCQLSFVSDTGVPQVPFWVTECGHIVCNSHLKLDQSCAQCGSQGIQLMPLQRDMDAPMSEWFQSLPHTFDGIASATKFQQETMALQIRYYKDKHQQRRVLIDRLKSEVAENRALKKEVEELRHENEELRQHLGFGVSPDQHDNHNEPSHFINTNGKRQRTEPTQHPNGIRTGTSSSPRSVQVDTPLGPNRLTVPLSQQPPNFPPRQDGNEGTSSYANPSGNSGASTYPTQQRPGSNRFDQFAYAPPSTPQLHPPKLSHVQAAPLRHFQRTTSNREQDPLQQTMPPPPLPSTSRFQPAQGRSLPMSSRQGTGQQNQNAPQTRDRRQIDMGPQAAPQHQPQSFGGIPQQGTRQQTQASPASFSNSAGMQSNNAIQSSRRSAMLPPTASRSMLPGNQRFPFPMTSKGTSQRFAPPTPSTSRFVASTASGSGSRAPSRANTESGGQRMPFIPGAQGGFG